MPSKGKNEMKSYRNLHVVAFVAAMMALGARAASVSSESRLVLSESQVMGAVSAWAAANGNAFATPGTALSARQVCDDDGTNVLYWIVSMSNGGAVIASPNNELDLVVAVLEKYEGDFPEGHPLPSILKRDMRNRLAVLARRDASSGGRPRLQVAAQDAGEANVALEESIAAAKAQWARYGVGSGRPKLRADSLDDGDGSPYVRRIVDGFESGGKFTFWGQSKLQGVDCFNLFTPYNAVCGCVATAGAAILQSFNCTNDPGVVSGVGCRYNNTPMSVKTKDGGTDWSLLPESMGGTNKNSLAESGYELLGRVAFNVGVLVGMEWSSGESGAQLKELVKAFKAYGFTTSRYVEYSGTTYTDGLEFFKTIYAQLWCGVPVALGISRETGGHAVVACGYARDGDGDEFCRLFMGWSGVGDGWYKLPTIIDYNVVDSAVTMIGYEDDAVVPICGETNIPGVDLVLPGYLTNGVPVAVPVDDNGYFSIRVPVGGLSDYRIVYEPLNKSADIMPLIDSAVFANENATRKALDAAIPDEILFPILNMTLKQTVGNACETAKNEGKAMLMVSGTPGNARRALLMNYLYYLDSKTDISNKFVLVLCKTNSSDPNEPDGDPTVGVFDPASFDVDERWKESNGRLEYETFVDYDASTNETTYVFSETDASFMTNRVSELLGNGYDAYARRHSGIVVTVSGGEAGKKAGIPFEVVSVVPDYGVVTNAWTNGEWAVFSAPGTYTNEEDGVIYSCVGWTTNRVSASTLLTNYVEGAKATLRLFADDDISLKWVWDVTHYRVTATSVGSFLEPYGDVTPTNAWVNAGGRVTVTAQVNSEKSRYFKEWESVEGKNTGDYRHFFNDSAGLFENGTTVSFYVNEPVAVVAKYAPGTNGIPETTTYTMTLKADPSWMESKVKPVSASGDLVWGANTTYDGILDVSPSVSRYVDSTGGVWVCTGWVVDGKTSASENAVVQGGKTAVAKWEIYVAPKPDDPTPTPGPDDPTPTPEPDDPTPPTPTPPSPDPIDISSIEQATDGSWTITVSGAVKDCWYWLYAADDLSKVAGSADNWTAPLAETTESNPQKATANGNVVFHTSVDAAKCFWRAKALGSNE